MKLRIVALCCLLVPFASLGHAEAAFTVKAEAQKEKPKRNEKVWPLFQGAPAETFAAWVGEKLVFPEYDDPAAASARTVTGFTIDEKGTVTAITSLESPDAALSGRIKTVLESSPAWTPASRRRRAEQTVYWLFVEPSDKQIRLVSEDSDAYVPATFNGKGLNAFREWVATHIQYPEYALQRGIQGRVVVGFTVNRQGRPVFDKLVSSPEYTLTDQVVGAFDKAHAWAPATIEGIPVQSPMELTIEFAIESAYGSARTIR